VRLDFVRIAGREPTRNDSDATPEPRTTAWAGISGNVSVPGLGHKGQEPLQFFIAVERVAAQLISRSNRMRTTSLADQLGQRNPVTRAWPLARPGTRLA
jgi:hypothetical protein